MNVHKGRIFSSLCFRIPRLISSKKSSKTYGEVNSESITARCSLRLPYNTHLLDFQGSIILWKQPMLMRSLLGIITREIFLMGGSGKGTGKEGREEKISFAFVERINK
ncbi:CLUMA_CG000372, isoform A [Clunio marinus]|uniref:CLUMA_CG000372, isoform A n=1 Tax=Clunio marinus TaxID=568069 RepID=A0A1J1HEU0_9DIPT|nr:CLUMA_CG000372, isoform A [Clunio marinus]